MKMIEKERNPHSFIYLSKDNRKRELREGTKPPLQLCILKNFKHI